MSRLILLFLLLVSFDGAHSSRSILRAVNDPDLPDVAVDLNSSSFDQVLKESPASFAVVEFFAQWCPACRNYKPQYETVARLFNGPDAVHPGIIFMARVDCALTTNTELCNRFSVRHYPMLLWGPPSKFAAGGWEPTEDKKGEILYIDDGRTSERLLNWINKQMRSSFSLEDKKYENEDMLRVNALDPGQIARAVYDVEEATANAFNIIVETKMIKYETRAPLIKFLQLLVAHHPSKRCRRGSAEILVNSDEFWPSNLLSETQQEVSPSPEKNMLKSFRICGKDVPRGYWIFCRGSKNDTRGFSCGLWVLLHSLSVRIEDGESHLTFTSICEFVQNFFICEECRQHFYKMCSSVSVPFNSTRDFTLWLWATHNEVNKRLMKEEADLGTGDPKFPKMIWPPKQLCSSCYLSSSKETNGSVGIDWDEDQVFKFLVSYYGKTLVSKSKDLSDSSSGETATEDIAASAHAVAVPVGAALAIAVASCAFGALACFWRSQQKNRKYLHHLHSLKNI
ncbi:sulfhydryl oxidase 2 isoform X1 [Aristolochia californica]|uniref:sulfhydryl oxidase 2 isoform X1 n=1 Tax=Aristolochia californica TaxID=171875 RepID=UPI0035D60429